MKTRIIIISAMFFCFFSICVPAYSQSSKKAKLKSDSIASTLSRPGGATSSSYARTIKSKSDSVNIQESNPQQSKAKDFNTTRSNRERGQDIFSTNPTDSIITKDSLSIKKKKGGKRNSIEHWGDPHENLNGKQI